LGGPPASSCDRQRPGGGAAAQPLAHPAKLGERFGLTAGAPCAQDGGATARYLSCSDAVMRAEVKRAQVRAARGT
jgi:hypothetical protein